MSTKRAWPVFPIVGSGRFGSIVRFLTGAARIRGRGSVLFGCLVVLVVVAQAHAGVNLDKPGFAFVPVATSADGSLARGAVINGNEITLVTDGTIEYRVFLEARIGNWDPDNTGVTIQAYVATLDATSYSTGLAGSLTAFTPPCTSSSECESLLGRGALCSPPGTYWPGRCAPALIDCYRPDFLFPGFTDVPCIPDAISPNVRWSNLVCIPPFFGDCFRSPEPYPPNGFYAGTLVVNVPSNARGTFTIRFSDDPPLDTFVLNGDNEVIGPLTLIPAKITVELCSDDPTDCNGNGVSDLCEIMDPDRDCNDTGILDECDILVGTSEDCNRNDRPDECDIAIGLSDDCNANLVPDECEPDCNGNAVPDDCDILGGVSADCDGNRTPDECQPDVDADGVIDACDGCPADANKLEPGVCGCGEPDTDSDLDTVLDCHDVCPGEDDRIDVNADGKPDCFFPPPIPAVTTWGVAILTLLMLSAARIRSRRGGRI